MVNEHFDPAAIFGRGCGRRAVVMLETPERVSAALVLTGKQPDFAEWIVSNRPHGRTRVVQPWLRAVAGCVTADRAEALLAPLRQAGATASLVSAASGGRFALPHREPARLGRCERR